MAIMMKCKMCGGDLALVPGSAIATCEYCGTTQTVPRQDDEKRLKQFARANRLRLGCEFDKASAVYEDIIADYEEEAEAYWGLVLCKYGVEYVTDPATGKKIPTCHRSSFDSVLDDPNFDLALENADTEARKLYREEAKALEEIRKGIIEVSSKEEPYDIFICYKETDENGDRTLDSVLAQDIYDALTEKGYRTFFARISLEDKLGQEYEPYIFAALNSAKVMLAVGTDYEYYNAVWVKNEWSRFLQLIASGHKKTLIPCFKGIDAYDMPKEFAKLQAQDLGKVGAMQDLLRGIDKLVSTAEVQPASIGIQADDVNNLIVYSNAMEIAKKKTVSSLKKAIRKLQSIAEYPDAKIKLAELKEQLKKRKRRRNVTVISVVLLFLSIVIVPLCHSISLRRHSPMAAGETYSAFVLKDGTVITAYSNQQSFHEVDTWTDVAMISAATGDALVGLRDDGTVVHFGLDYTNSFKLNEWSNLKDIASTGNHTVGLGMDGTVLAEGANAVGQCEVSEWTDIVDVAVGNGTTIGLKSDGSVVATGLNQDGQCNVEEWTDVIAISACRYQTVGLRSDGTVLATGSNAYGQCEVSAWADIIGVSAGLYHTVGLKSDGTVLAVGLNGDGQCNVEDWTDIIAISAGNNQTLGLKKDGTILYAGPDVEYLEELASVSNVRAR